MCPLEFCTDDFYNFNVYADPEQFDIVKYRKYLAFPAALRLRQKIKFSVNCDIYAAGFFLYKIITS